MFVSSLIVSPSSDWTCLLVTWKPDGKIFAPLWKKFWDQRRDMSGLVLPDFLLSDTPSTTSLSSHPFHDFLTLTARQLVQVSSTEFSRGFLSPIAVNIPPRPPTVVDHHGDPKTVYSRTYAGQAILGGTLCCLIRAAALASRK